jgi:hypothetical protein
MKEVVKIREGGYGAIFSIKERIDARRGERRERTVILQVEGEADLGANMTMGQSVRVAQLVCTDCATRYSFRRPGEISIGAVP